MFLYSSISGRSRPSHGSSRLRSSPRLCRKEHAAWLTAPGRGWHGAQGHLDAPSSGTTTRSVMGTPPVDTPTAERWDPLLQGRRRGRLAAAATWPAEDLEVTGVQGDSRCNRRHCGSVTSAGWLLPNAGGVSPALVVSELAARWAKVAAVAQSGPRSDRSGASGAAGHERQRAVLSVGSEAVGTNSHARGPQRGAAAARGVTIDLRCGRQAKPPACSATVACGDRAQAEVAAV